jgi:hypothetical protein
MLAIPFIAQVPGPFRQDQDHSPELRSEPFDTRVKLAGRGNQVERAAHHIFTRHVADNL